MPLVFLGGWLDIQTMNAFASESGTANTVPSTAIIRSSPKKAPGVWSVASGRTTWWNRRVMALHPTRCLASVIDDLHGTRQYCPTLTQASLKPSTRFFKTVLMEALDHKLMATIRQTTKCDGKARFRSDWLCVSVSACSIASEGIAISRIFEYRTWFDNRWDQGEFFELHSKLSTFRGQRSVNLVLGLTEPYCGVTSVFLFRRDNFRLMLFRLYALSLDSTISSHAREKHDVLGLYGVTIMRASTDAYASLRSSYVSISLGFPLHSSIRVRALAS